MKNNYTAYNRDSISEYASIYAIDEAVDYLKNPESFRTFDKGLIELLERKGYSGDTNNIAGMSEYLVSKLEGIHSSVKKDTVVSWLSGKHSPKIEAGSRQKIYEICFSLNLTYQETLWFFQHVYYDRAFNCHTIEEAVFYYAFLNGIDYLQAKQIIRAIEEASAPAMGGDDMEPNYTQSVQRRISEFTSTDELKEFLIANKENFRAWNKSASKTLHNLVALFVDPPEIKSEVNNLKRSLAQQLKSKPGDLKSLHLTDMPIYQSCGLLMKEILFDAENPDETYGDARMAPAESVMEMIDNRNTHSNTFVLEHLLTTSSGMKKNLEIPYVVRNNFPSKKTMSDILSEEKISTLKSYDGIRKMIILFDFYRFWVNVKLGIGYTDLTENELFETYCEEANCCLYECGYEGLYQGNPYDWIFLSSALSEEPLVYLRSYIAELDGE